MVRLWMSHGVRIFRVDNPHTKPVAFWEWLLKEVRRTDPDVLFLAEAFTRPAMMRGLGAIGFHQSLHVLHLAQRKWELEDYLRELVDRDRPPDAAELLREHPRHPARLPAVRRPGGVQDPRRDRGHRLPELGRVRRLRALRARRGQAGQRGVPRLGEVPDPDPRLGRRGRRGPHARAVPHPAQRDPPRSTPRCSSCATSRSTAATTRTCSSSPSSRRRDGRRRRDRRGQPRPARHARDHGPPRPARARPATGTTRSPCTTRSPARTGAGASTTTCGSTPATSPPTS